jgi:hypothetical protein
MESREVELVVVLTEAVSDKERVDSERLEALVRFKGIMLRCCFDGILWSLDWNKNANYEVVILGSS